MVPPVMLMVLDPGIAQWWNVAAPGTLMNDMKAATRVGNYAVSGSPCC